YHVIAARPLPRARAVAGESWRPPRARCCLRGAACVAVFTYCAASSVTIGAGLVPYPPVHEMLQHFSPARTPAFTDFTCNAAGVLLDIALLALVERLAGAGPGGHKRRAAQQSRARPRASRRPTRILRRDADAADEHGGVGCTFDRRLQSVGGKRRVDRIRE